jgi:hypothetical protein
MDDNKPFNWRDHLKVHPAADLFPLMSGAELKELAGDIRRNGLQTAIVLWAASKDDPHWLLVDGRNRLDALALSGSLAIDDEGQLCRVMPDGELSHISGIGHHHHPPCDPYAHAVSLNIHRRHLTAEDKRDLIAKLLKASPEKSDRSIAKLAKTSPTTVGAVRSTVQSGQLEKRIGADGKARAQPAHREKIRRAEATKLKRAAEMRKERENYHEYMDEKISRFACKLIQLDATLARELWEIIAEGGDPHQLMDDLQTGIATNNNDDGLTLPDYLKRAAP